MVICNVVYDPIIEDDLINELKNSPVVNTIDSITHIRSEVPTLFYGYKHAKKCLGEKMTRGSTDVNKYYCWSYSDAEIKAENWVKKFIEQSGKQWFEHVDSSIDVVFEELDVDKFIEYLHPWPMIHEGTYEIYVADWSQNSNIKIHSIKKDTLEYLDIDPKDFLQELYDKLDYNFLAIEAQKFDLSDDKFPVFLDDMLYASTNTWTGIDDIIDYFRGTGVEIDRKKVIVYYLRKSAFLRRYFSQYK